MAELELEDAILASGRLARLDSSRFVPWVAGKAIWECYRRRLWHQPLFSRLFPLPKTASVFAVLIGPRFRNCLPWFLASSASHVYLFDAWPRHLPLITRFAADFRLRTIFTPVTPSVQPLSHLLPETAIHWIPEGITPSLFHFHPLCEKNIHVMQYGRKWDAYHQQIVQPLAEHGITYLYEKVKGQVIFPGRPDFLEALARTRISLCFPSGLTHPANVGDTSIMTHRYLEAMVARCLPVGIQPPEMHDLFGYDPVIPVNLDDPAGQLLDILSRFEKYQDLVEQNFRTVRASHTWRHRWDQMSSILGLI